MLNIFILTTGRSYGSVRSVRKSFVNTGFFFITFCYDVSHFFLSLKHVATEQSFFHDMLVGSAFIFTNIFLEPNAVRRWPFFLFATVRHLGISAIIRSYPFRSSSVPTAAAPATRLLPGFIARCSRTLTVH